MEACEECRSVEQGFTMQKDEENGGMMWVCDQCGAEESKVYVNEDYGQDR